MRLIVEFCYAFESIERLRRLESLMFRNLACLERSKDGSSVVRYALETPAQIVKFFRDYANLLGYELSPKFLKVEISSQNRERPASSYVGIIC